MAKKFLVDLDLNLNELKNAVLENLAEDPANPSEGQMYFNTTTHKYRVYGNGKWSEMGTGGGSVTSVSVSNADNGGLTVSGSPITTSGTIKVGHTNKIAAQSVLGLYPIKYDGNGHITEVGKAAKIPTTTGELQNNSGFITKSALPTKVSDLENDSKFISGISSGDVTTALGYTPYNSTNPSGFITKEVNNLTNYTPSKSLKTVATTGAYGDLTGTPTKLTDFTNDLAYMTAYNANTNKIATKTDLNNAIAGVAGGMMFKGTVGQGGTAGTTLPSSGVKVGDTYRISSAGTFGGQSNCNIGDLFIATATTPTWAYIPSGNDKAVTSVVAGTGLTGGTITSTGTIGLATSGVKAGTYNGITVDSYGRVTGAADKGYTTNKGTVTSVTVSGQEGLTTSGSPITDSGAIIVKHTNKIAAQNTQAVYPIKVDGNGHISAMGSAVTILKKWTGVIKGDNSKTVFTLPHNLNTKDIVISVYDAATDEDVILDVARKDNNNATATFAKAPKTTESYKVVIIG